MDLFGSRADEDSSIWHSLTYVQVKSGECMMENVIPFTMTFVSVKDIIIPCLKLERGNVCSLFFEGNVIQDIIRCKYLSSTLV